MCNEIRACQNCGCVFFMSKATPHTKRYCSERCARAHNQRRRRERKKAEQMEHPKIYFAPRSTRCPECGIWFETIYPYKTYCSKSCRRKAIDKIDWERLKRDNPEKYIEKLEKNRDISKHWRDGHKEKGNCSRCGKPNPNEPLTVCSNCIERRER